MNWYLQALRKYVGFSGRAHRTEFWMFTLVSTIISIALVIVDVSLGLGDEYGGVLSSIYALAVFLPALAVGSRRLHDIDRTGWWQLLLIVPLLGLIVLIVFWVKESDAGSNEHGPNPWGAPAPAAEF